MTKVTILRGISGAGKSTFTKTHLPNAVVASADHYFGHGDNYKFDHTKLGKAHDFCYDTFTAAVDSGREVVVDNTNTKLKEFKRYLDYAAKKGCTVEVVRLKVDPKVAAARNVHGVPYDTVMNMQNRFQDFSGEQIWIDGIKQ